MHDLQPLSLPYSPYIHFTLFIGCKGNNNNNNNYSNNNLQDLQPLDVCGMERAGSVAKLMVCAILNDCMVCPAQENEAVALSNNIVIYYIFQQKREHL